MLEIEKIRAVPERVQLGRDRAHDGHHRAVLQLGIDGLQAIDALHRGSSHIKSRLSSSATGDSELCARVIAFVSFGSTSSGRLRSSWAMWSASSTGRVYLPPSVCQGSFSPKPPRSVISIKSGILYSSETP